MQRKKKVSNKNTTIYNIVMDIYNNNNDYNLVDSFTFYDDLSDENIEDAIMNELNSSLHELGQDIDNINDIYKSLSSMVYIQGDKIKLTDRDIETSVVGMEEGTEILEKIKINGTKIIRDTAMVVVGGIIGAVGFFLGPLVGIGGIVAGITVGGAAVYGTHKKIDSK